MLMCDTFRGHHSTGVFSYFKPYNMDPFFKVTKDGMDGFDFGRSKLFAEAVTHMTESTYSKGSFISNNAKAVFGHNRHATIGAVNAKNAHPFTHGKITLAHNGTLRNQSLLPDHKNFEVDSDNIAYSIDKIGVDETVKLLNGAYALIWFNAEENTLNFLRNSERPFHFFETTAGDWFGCSEKKMGEWLLDREKPSKTIKRSFSAEVGTHYVFSLEDGCVLKEERKLELPTFPAKTSYTSRWDEWDDAGLSERKGSSSKGSHKTSQGTTYRSPDSVIQDLNIAEGTSFARDQVFEFEMFNFKPYIGNPARGCVTGWIPTLTEYVEVQLHNIEAELFKDGSTAIATLVSAYIMQHTVHFVAKDIVKENSNVVNFPVVKTEVADGGDEPVVISKTRTGEIFSERGWRSSIHNTCAACNDPIPFDEIGEVEIINGYSFCKACTDVQDEEYELTEEEVASVTTLLEDIEEIPEEVDERPEGWCNHCATVHNQFVTTGNMDKEYWEGMADTCPIKIQFKDKFRPVLSLNKEVSGSDHDRFQGEAVPDEASPEPLVKINGLFMNKEQWGRINVCRCCDIRIPFDDVGRITFWGEAPLCYRCSVEMQSMD